MCFIKKISLCENDTGITSHSKSCDEWAFRSTYVAFSQKTETKERQGNVQPLCQDLSRIKLG